MSPLRQRVLRLWLLEPNYAVFKEWGNTLWCLDEISVNHAGFSWIISFKFDWHTSVHDLHIARSNAQLSSFSSTFFSLMTALQVPKMKLTEQVGGVEDWWRRWMLCWHEGQINTGRRSFSLTYCSYIRYNWSLKSLVFSSFWNFNEIPFSHLRLLLSSRRKAASEKPEDSQNVSACETEMVCNSWSCALLALWFTVIIRVMV